MLQLSANGQSLMSHIDDDGIMTMMWAKMSAVISSDSKKATNYVALGGRKERPRCRSIAAGKIQSSLFGFSAL